MASSKKLILSLATISCLSSLALAQISGPQPAITFNPDDYNYSYYGILGYAPGTQIEIQGNNTTNSLFLGKYAYVSYDNGTHTKTLHARVNNSDKLTIQNIINKGIVNGALSIENQGQAQDVSIDINNINNQGYIRNVYIGIWGERNGKIELDSFKNSALIYNTDNNGVLFEGKDVKIGKFINTGIIVGDYQNNSNKASVAIGQSNNNYGNTTIGLFLNEGLIGSDQSRFGVRFELGKQEQNSQKPPHKATIDHFINTGTIKSKSTGISIVEATLKNFLNMGLIESGMEQYARAVEFYEKVKIENFTNAGTIKANNNAGIIFRKSEVARFTNTGTISGKVGVALYGTTLSNFLNTGIITSNHDQAGAILLTSYNGNGQKTTITNFINTGTIVSTQHDGLFIETQSSIDHLYNKGMILAKQDGIALFSDGGSNKAEIKDITLAKGSMILAGNYGLNLSVLGNGQTTDQPVFVDAINIQEGAMLYGNKAAIYIGQNKDKNNNKKDNTVGQIIVAGEVKGGSEGGIVNEGTIKASENKSSSENGKKRSRRSLEDSSNQQSDEENKAAILIKESGQITSTSGYGIVNKAMIDGSIISKSSSNI
ncbi:hypothetical protein DZC71_07570, partial [Campylobacter hepaticus]